MQDAILVLKVWQMLLIKRASMIVRMESNQVVRLVRRLKRQFCYVDIFVKGVFLAVQVVWIVCSIET